MGALAVKEKLAIGVQNFSDAPRIIDIAYLAADLQKENVAANDELVEGPYHDSETGLHYWGARYYDPKTGRGISADGMSVAEHVRRWRRNLGAPNRPPLELNPYVYTANNPLRWIDPTGRETTISDLLKLGRGANLIIEGAKAAKSIADWDPNAKPQPPCTGPVCGGGGNMGGAGASSCFGDECEQCQKDAFDRYNICKASGNSCPTDQKNQNENQCAAQYLVDLMSCRAGGSHGASGSW